MVSATFSQRFLYAVLNTGELLKLRFLLKVSIIRSIRIDAIFV